MDGNHLPGVDRLYDDLDQNLTVADVEEKIDSIDDPLTHERVSMIYDRLKSRKYRASEQEMKALADEIDIPRHLLDKAFESSNSSDVESLRDEHDLQHAIGATRLEKFVTLLKKPYNLLYIDQSISKAELEERMFDLAVLQSEFERASSDERDKMEEIMVEMFGITEIPEQTQQYIDSIAAHPATLHSQGAENKNLIFLGKKLEARVLKISKDRHDVDFLSILKLMYNMHALVLRLEHDPDPADNVKINVCFDDMVVYRDSNGNFKRMVRQKFAKGVTIKELPAEVKQNDPDFKRAWQIFLEKIESMKETDGIVLDISDSDAGFKKVRGDVANTGNVFVQLPTEGNPNYEFSIIDPDVFDTDPGQHKFYAKEYLRKGGVRAALKAVKVAATNQARERVVAKWQDEYVKKWLS